MSEPSDDTVISQDIILNHYVSRETEFASYTKIMFIDDSVENASDVLFSTYCTEDTYPLVYTYSTDRQSIVDFLTVFNKTNIKRISFAFHGPNDVYDSYPVVRFIHQEPLFVDSDLLENATVLSDNFVFVKWLISQFSLENIDFLGCNLLQIESYKQYFELLKGDGNVLIGASDDNTGNLKYGGDWVLENTMENIKEIYFNDTITTYADLLLNYDVIINGIRYGYSDSSTNAWVSLTQTRVTGDIVIQANFGTNNKIYYVTSIHHSAFKDEDWMTSIVIPSTVTSIGDTAFRSCNRLSSVTFETDSNLISIGSYAFHSCYDLTSISIPPSVTSIGNFAFFFSGLSTAYVNVDRFGLTNFPIDIGPAETIGGETGYHWI